MPNCHCRYISHIFLSIFDENIFIILMNKKDYHQTLSGKVAVELQVMHLIKSSMNVVCILQCLVLSIVTIRSKYNMTKQAVF